MDDDDWDLYAVVRSCKAVTPTRASPTSPTPNPVHHDGVDEPSWMWDWMKREEEVETHAPAAAAFSNLELESNRADAFHGLEEFYKPFFPSPTVDNIITTTTTTTTTISYAPAGTIIPNSPTSFISDFGGGSTISGQQQLQQQNNFLPANTKSSHFNPGLTPVSGLVRLPEQQLLQLPNLVKSEHPEEVIPMLNPVANLVSPSMPPLQIPTHLIRTRKRKSPVKKMVCHLTAENLSSSDLWAWRKYGQKPIKGSPHPRNYYRCSSSKGCSARKQVERSNEDPNMFVVTYCGEHTHPRPTHRNSLAGSTRNKAAATTSKAKDPESPSVPAQGGGDDDEQGAINNSGDGDKASEEAEDDEMEEEEDDEEFVVSSSEDIFLGMKQLGRTGLGGSTLGSLGAGTSGGGFTTKQSDFGSSWGPSCSSSAGAAVSGGC